MSKDNCQVICAIWCLLVHHLCTLTTSDYMVLFLVHYILSYELHRFSLGTYLGISRSNLVLNEQQIKAFAGNSFFDAIIVVGARLYFGKTWGYIVSGVSGYIIPRVIVDWD